MPRIRDYTAPTVNLNPSDRAQQSWETVGRRVGPLYNQAAQDIREAGNVRGAVIRSQASGLDIAALYAHNAPRVNQSSSNVTRSSAGGGETYLSGGIGEQPLRGVAGGVMGYTPPSYDANDLAEMWDDYRNDMAELGYDVGGNRIIEAGVSAVGMSRMAVAVAGGGRGGRGGGRGGPASGDIPLNWRDNPYYNGKNVITDEEGNQFTPYQLDQIRKRQWDEVMRNSVRNNNETARIQRRQADAFAREAERSRQKLDKEYDARQQDWQDNWDASWKRVDRAAQQILRDHPDWSPGDAQRAATGAIMPGYVYNPYPPKMNKKEDEDFQYRIRYGTPTALDTVRAVPYAVKDAASDVVNGVRGVLNNIFGNDDQATARMPQE